MSRRKRAPWAQGDLIPGFEKVARVYAGGSCLLSVLVERLTERSGWRRSSVERVLRERFKITQSPAGGDVAVGVVLGGANDVR